MSTGRQSGRPVVAVGAHVRFRGSRWQVVALAGQCVHLAGEDGSDEAVLTGHLFADPGFALLGAEAQQPQAAPRWGLFETAPAAAREKALAWQRHIREVECGLPGGPGSGGPVREQYDPAQHTLAQRERAKAAELTALGFGRVSRTTVQRMRLAYRKQGLWGLIDHRTTRGPSPTGRADERVVAAVKEALRRQRGRSKGTVKGLMPLVAHILEDRHGGTVAMPAQATFYRLVHQLAGPADHPAQPVRTPPITEDGRGHTPTVALRPGEQVQIDTTRLDVLALFDDGTLGRPEMTIAVDVATRAILAAVLCPGGTQAVDAALLLAEMAVPHPSKPTWPHALRFTHTPLLPRARLLTLDERLQGAAARPVVIPETIVVDRGKVFLSRAFTAACETLGVSVQPAPPYAPTAKGIVERTFGSINTLFCQHLPGYTGSDVTRRGRDAEREACFTVPQLQDLLDEWLVHYHHRPHQGLRHPVLPRAALTPNQMWAALISVAGYVPVPLTRDDYLELLPVRWQAITERGIRLHHRTYDCDLLAPYRGQPSPIAARGGKWEVHTNPHDARQIWLRLPDGTFAEIPWIHRAHVHRPFNEQTWQHIRTTVTRHTDPDSLEADLADALDQLMRRTRTGTATTGEQRLLARTQPARTPPAPTAPRTRPPGRDRRRPDGARDGHRQPRRPRRGTGPGRGRRRRRRRPARRPLHRTRSLRRPRGGPEMVNTRPPATAGDPGSTTTPAAGPAQQSTTDTTTASWPVTTWQGWHHFATTAPPAPPQPGEAPRSPEERLAYHSAFVTVRTPAIDTLATSVRTLMILGRHQTTTARPSLIVTGPAAAGKTTALLHVGRTCHLAHTHRTPSPPGHHPQVPVAYVLVPPGATAKTLTAEFARYLGIPTTTRMTQAQITEAVCHTYNTAGVRLVLIDEIHRLNPRTTTGAQAADLLKDLTERISATFVYAGLDVTATPLFSGVRGAQLAGRATLITCGALPARHGNRHPFTDVITDLENALDLHHHRRGTLPRHATYLHQRTAGRIGSLTRLIRQAAITAISDGTERITKKTLEAIQLDHLAEQHKRPHTRRPSAPA